MLPWLLIAAEYYGVSSQTGSTITAQNGVDVLVDDVSACRTAFRMSSGSYSGLKEYDPVQRKLKALWRVPKAASSRNAKR